MGVSGVDLLVTLSPSVFRLDLINGGGIDTYTLFFTAKGITTTAGTVGETDSAASIQSQLEVQSNIDVGDVVVTGDAGGPYTITFLGQYIGQTVVLTSGDESGSLETNVTTSTVDMSILDSVTGTPDLNEAQGVIVGKSGQYAYAIAGAGDAFTVINISDPSNLSIEGSVTDSTNLNEPTDLAVNEAETLAFTCNFTGKGVTVIDISTKTAPVILGQIVNDVTNLDRPDACTLGASEDYLYVSSIGTPRFAVVNVTVPGTPAVDGSVAVSGAPLGVAVDKTESYAYLTSSANDTIKVYDITTKTTPTLDNTVALANDPRSANVCADTLYVNTDDDGLIHSFDISDPQDPSLLQSYDGLKTFAMARYFGVNCDLRLAAFASVTDSMVALVDISSPHNMKVLGVYVDVANFPALEGRIGVGSSAVYVADTTNDDVTSVDISTLEGTEIPLGGERNATLNLGTDEADGTNKYSAGWHVGVMTIRNWSIEAEQLKLASDDAAEAFKRAHLNKQPLNVRVRTGFDGKIMLGTALLTDDTIDGPHDDLVAQNVTLTGVTTLVELDD